MIIFSTLEARWRKGGGEGRGEGGGKTRFIVLVREGSSTHIPAT